MATSTQIKDAFEIESKHTAFYTGGNIEWHDDVFFCQTTSSINLFNTIDGTISKSIGEENNEDADFIQTFTSDGVKIVSSHKSGLLKLWNENGELEKVWKYIHKGPIAKLRLKDDILASGGADSSVRIWNLEHQACILGLKGCQGVVNVVEFHKNDILASGDDGKILHWNLTSGKLLIIYDKHYSKVTSLVFTHDDTHFVSCGRDKVMMLWKFGDDTPLKSIPFYESVECIVSLPEKFKVPGYKSDPDNFYVASAGEKGVIRVWDVLNVKEVYVQDNSLVTPHEGAVAVTNLLFNATSKSLAVVTYEQNIIIHHLKSFACMKQYVGFTDEILDIKFYGQNSEYLAVATNSCDIKLYDNATMNCQLLKGHNDIVLSLAVSKTDPNLLLSSSKDNTIRLWYFTYNVTCVGLGKRHTSSVGSCCFSQTNTNFAVSVSQDLCLKKWQIPQKFDKLQNLTCTKTEICHQKDINGVAVSPNDKFIGTASQDKTAKLWNENLELLGVLRGHKRGVWSIKFSPIDQVALTSSADCSIKLWNINDLTCLKTFQGHESSVLNAEFLTSGYQILSSGADGLLKIFSIKTSECQVTLDAHEGKIWAMALKNDDSCIVTGGSDSNLIKWKDVTETKRSEALQLQEEQILDEQKLENYLFNGKLLKALKLALRLEKTHRVMKIIQEIIKKNNVGLSSTISELRDDQKDALLKSAIDWNTNSKNCQAAQMVINILLNEIQAGDFKPSNFANVIENTLPYTERHFKRLTQLMQDLHFVNYTINCMKPQIKH